MSVDDLELSDEEHELATGALTYFLRGALIPLHDSNMLSVQSDNYGERTAAIYVLNPEVFTNHFVSICQAWLRMPEFVSWRILFKCAWKNPIDVTLYPDAVFWNRKRSDFEEVVSLMAKPPLKRKNG